MTLVRLNPAMIPRSPARLLTVAARMDATWAALERAGFARPSLEAELALWQSQGLALVVEEEPA